MKTSCRHAGRGLCAVLAATLVALPAMAGTLEGTVVGNGGVPKRFVRVEVTGPDTAASFTGPKGTFVMDLAGGRYTVRVTERNRRMEFEDIQVPAEGQVSQTFQVAW